MNCRTCQSALGLLAEIVARVRQLPPAKQVKWRAEILRRNLPDKPSSPRSN
jgi:hypothetical protein